jgi:hypothetical protein
LVVVLAAVLPYGTIYQALCGSGPDPDRAMGQYIRDHSAPDEGVLALDWHGFQIHAWSDRPSPSRWFNKFFLELPQARKELARDLARRPPKFVALPAWFGDDPWPNYMLAIQPRYKLVYTDRRKNPVEQYELFELQPAGGRPG